MNETFVVKILYNQHASWQGSVDWITGDTKKTQNFRSALELIRLIDSALENEAPRVWKDAEDLPAAEYEHTDPGT